MNSRRVASKSKLPRRQSSDVLALERRGYSFGKKIGKGSYGCVVRAQYEDKSLGQTVELACKYVDRNKAPKDFLQKFFPREIEILTQISHPNIIGIHSILQSGSTVFIFMRWAENGDLLDYVKKFGAIPEIQANLWFFQMVSAVKYIHSLDYSHRDLKCENILISKHMNLKLADFGFSRKCVDERNEKILSETFCGSAAYAPPEICSGTPYDPKKSDVWSLGVILFIMLNAIMPFDDENTAKLIRDQKARRYHFRQEIACKWSLECKQTLNALLDPNPETRVDINQVYEMKWLRKHVEKTLAVDSANLSQNF